MLPAQRLDELLVRFLLARLVENAHVRLSPVERLGGFAEAAGETVVNEGELQGAFEGFVDGLVGGEDWNISWESVSRRVDTEICIFGTEGRKKAIQVWIVLCLIFFWGADSPSENRHRRQAHRRRRWWFRGPRPG